MTLSDLLTRLEEADGPSRELDARLWAEFDGRDIVRKSNALFARSRVPPHDECWIHTLNEKGDWQPNRLWDGVPKFTASVDVALALVERKLPGQVIPILMTATDEVVSTAKAKGRSFPVLGSDMTKLLPKALLIALLRALQEEGR